MRQHALSGLTSTVVIDRCRRYLKAAGMLGGDDLTALDGSSYSALSLTPRADAASRAERTPERAPMSGAAAVSPAPQQGCPVPRRCLPQRLSGLSWSGIIAPPFWQRKAQVVQPEAQFEVVSN